ncbi:FAD-dependent oxidoreductase [Chloroflexota bacterium]
MSQYTGTRFKKLFEPGKIGKLETKNRIVMSAMLHGIVEPDGRLSQRVIDYYEARAKGGTGLIFIRVPTVGWLGQVADTELAASRMIADSKTHADQLAQLADVLHNYGTKLGLQLSPGGGRTIGLEDLRKRGAVSPSPVPCVWDTSIIARELSIEEIERLIEAFVCYAKAVCTAGIDAVEINSHGGYLFDQFLTELWNKRTDKYGGDINGRFTFHRELISAIKKGVGADFPVTVKFALTHFMEGGREIEEGVQITRQLEEAGVDAINIDAGCQETMYWEYLTTYQQPGAQVVLAEKVKKAISIPVITGGKLGYPELAEEALREKKADFIALGRSLLADPDWPNKVKAERLEDIRHCLGDNECLKRMFAGEYVSCTLNPTTGMERKYALTPADKKKSVLVIGGGPGGMEAARIAALRGHKVTLYEKGYALGGNLLLVSLPDFKNDYRKLLGYLSTQIKKLGVEVRLGKEVTPELVQEMKPDTVILATGGVFDPPQIPGFDRDNVMSTLDIRDMLRGRLKWSSIMQKKGWQKILWFAGNSFAKLFKPPVIRWMARFWVPFGRRVVILGGSHGECELALYLASKGKKVTIVEASTVIASEEQASNQMYLLKLLGDTSVDILTSTKVLEITEQGLIIADKDGKESSLVADTVVLPIDLRPDQRLLEALKSKVPEIYAIGDCVEPLKIVRRAIWEGFDIARQI